MRGRVGGNFGGYSPKPTFLGWRSWRSEYILLLGRFSCVWLFATPMGCSLPGSSVHGILQARILDWVAMPSSSGSSWPRDRTGVHCRQILYHWATRVALRPLRQHKALEGKAICTCLCISSAWPQFQIHNRCSTIVKLRNKWVLLFQHQHVGPCDACYEGW